MKQLKVLELFAGTRSIGKEFDKKGHLVYSVELDRQHENIDWYGDINVITADEIIERMGGLPDVIWASPPCEKFSVAAIGRHWIKGTNLPKTEDTKEALALLERTVKLIKELNPKYFFIENPRGKMRKMDCMQEFDRYTVTYCQYGDERMKPTDLWTNHPNPNFKPPCKNGDPCHVAAPRGSQTGTQGIKTYKDRSRIPEQLCKHISDICEEGFENVIDIKYIAEELIRNAKDSTSEGNWIYDIEEIENWFDIKLNKLIMHRIKDLLEGNDDVADVQLYDDCIDIMLYQGSF